MAGTLPVAETFRETKKRLTRAPQGSECHNPSSSVKDLCPGVSLDISSIIWEKTRDFNFSDICTLLDQIHEFEYYAGVYENLNSVRIFGPNPEKNISVYESILEGVMIGSSTDPSGIMRSIENLMSECFSAPDQAPFDRTVLTDPEHHLLHLISSRRKPIFSCSLFLALRSATRSFPALGRQLTCLCLSCVHQATRKFRSYIARDIINSGESEDVANIVYLLNLGVLLCLVVKQNVSASRRLEHSKFFACSHEDFAAHEDLFTACLTKDSIELKYSSIEFSQYSVSEPRMFCEAVVLFCRAFKDRINQRSIPDVLCRKIDGLFELCSRLRDFFTPAMDAKGPHMTSAILRPPSLSRFPARCLKASHVHIADRTDVQATVSKNSGTKKQRIKHRKRGMADQRYEKDKHVKVVKENIRQRDSTAQAAYRKILCELQDQEHTMKTVDHHKALAMKGKKKKQ